ncbi:hypothetical protein ABFS82_11G119800 [Erythranthe guttata]
MVLVPPSHIPIPPGEHIVQPGWKKVPIGSIVEPPPNPRPCRSRSHDPVYPRTASTPQCVFELVVPPGRKLVPSGYAVAPPGWTVAPFGVTETMNPNTHFACPKNWTVHHPHNV